MVAELAETLSGRPPSDSYQDIVDGLGEPAVVARAVRRESGYLGSVSLWRRWRTLPPALRVAHVLVVIAVAGGVVGAWKYFTAAPEFTQGCSGVIATDVDHSSAAGESEYRVPFVQDGRLGAFICLGADRSGVTVTNVSVRNAIQMAMQPVGIEMANRRVVDLKPPVGDASDFEPYDPTADPSVYLIWWFEMEYCHITGQVYWLTYDLEYRYRGRTRTAVLDWPYRLSVEGDCGSAERTDVDERSAGWYSVVGNDTRGLGETLTSQNLSPESVSRDLCRFLRGVEPPVDLNGNHTHDEFEPLSARAVFNLGDAALSETLIDGAVLGICPEFADRRDELVSMLKP